MKFKTSYITDQITVLALLIFIHLKMGAWWMLILIIIYAVDLGMRMMRVMLEVMLDD